MPKQKDSGKRKGGMGKRKGGSYEITVARILSKWFDPDAKVDLFWRSASSGAQASMAKRFGRKSNQWGDIKASSDETMFVTDAVFFEVKFYKDWRIDTVLTNKGCLIRDWWIKCYQEATAVNKIPVLIFKRNNSPDFILFSDKFVMELVGWNCCFKLGCIRFDIDMGEEALQGVSMYRLDYFLKHIDPMTLKAMVNK